MNYWEMAGKFFVGCLVLWVVFIVIMIISACVHDYLREMAKKKVEKDLYKFLTIEELEDLRHVIGYKMHERHGLKYNNDEHPLFI